MVVVHLDINRPISVEVVDGRVLKNVDLHVDLDVHHHIDLLERPNSPNSTWFDEGIGCRSRRRRRPSPPSDSL